MPLTPTARVVHTHRDFNVGVVNSIEKHKFNRTTTGAQYSGAVSPNAVSLNAASPKDAKDATAADLSIKKRSNM